MPFPKDPRALDRLFRAGQLPKPLDLRDIWNLEPLTGPLTWTDRSRLMVWLGGHDGADGGRILADGSCRYHFHFEREACEFDGQPALALNHALPTNLLRFEFLTLGRRDYLRQLEPGVFLGRAYQWRFGRCWFLGYYGLTLAR